MQATRNAIWLATAFAVAGCTTLGSQIKSSGAMASEDTDYIATAYQLAELDNAAGMLVPNKSKDPRVVEVSSELVSQANALTPELTSALQAEGVTPPKGLPPDLQAQVDQLHSLNGPAFDHAYLNDEITLHQKAVTVFKKEDADTKNSVMRTQVEAELPAVQNDLARLQSVANPSAT